MKTCTGEYVQGDAKQLCLSRVGHQESLWMMSDFMAMPKRQPSDRAARARHAQKLIKPFVPPFERWNEQPAKVSAMALSHMLSADERAQQARILHDLFREVQASSD